MADPITIGAGIAALVGGMLAGGAAEERKKKEEEKKLSVQAFNDAYEKAIMEGNVEAAQHFGKLIGIDPKEAANVAQATAKAKVALTEAKATLMLERLRQLGVPLPGQPQQPSTQPTEAAAPLTGTEAFGAMMAPGVTTETLPQRGPRPLGFPTPPVRPLTPAPVRRPVPPAPSPIELKGITVSKEGDISFSAGLKGMNEQVLGRMSQLMNEMSAEQAIKQARSENLPIDPKQEEAFHQVDFAKVMNKFYTDNREEFERRGVDLRTRYILAFKHASNILGPAFAPPELRAFVTEKPKIRDETEETIMAERAKTGTPLDAPITAKEIADAREQLRRERRGEKIFEAGPITQLKKETELGVPERPGPTERKEISERLAMFDTLSAIRLTFDPAFVGFLAGRTRGMVTKVFGTTVKEATFRTEAANIKNSTIRAITGAQVGGPQEADRIMQQIPDLNDPPTTFAGKFNSTWRNHISLQIRRAQVEEASGIFVSELVWRKIDSEIAAYEKAFGGKFILDRGIMNAPLPTGEPPPYLRSKGVGQPLR